MPRRLFKIVSNSLPRKYSRYLSTPTFVLKDVVWAIGDFYTLNRKPFDSKLPAKQLLQVCDSDLFKQAGIVLDVRMIKTADWRTITQFFNLPRLVALKKTDLIKQPDTEHATLHQTGAEQSSAMHINVDTSVVKKSRLHKIQDTNVRQTTDYNFGDENMLIRFKTFVVALICCLASSSAMADSDILNSSLILSGGLSKAQNACDSPWLTYGLNSGGTCKETNTALRLAYNYKFTPVWGIEASYGDLGNATANGISTAYGTPATWSMKAIGWSFAGTAAVPVGGGFSLLGKLGTVRAEFTETIHTTSTTGQVMQGISFNGAPITRQNKNALTYGIGLQYELNKQFALRAQYESFGKYDMYGSYGISAPRIGLSLVSAGFVLKF